MAERVTDRAKELRERGVPEDFALVIAVLDDESRARLRGATRMRDLYRAEGARASQLEARAEAAERERDEARAELAMLDVTSENRLLGWEMARRLRNKWRHACLAACKRAERLRLELVEVKAVELVEAQREDIASLQASWDRENARAARAEAERDRLLQSLVMLASSAERYRNRCGWAERDADQFLALGAAIEGARAALATETGKEPSR